MRFELSAFHPLEGPRVLRIEAADAAAASAQAAREGLVVLEVRMRGRASLRRTRRFPLLQFAGELLALDAAGLTLVEALDTLLEKERAGDVGRVIGSVRARLAEGRAFSAALEAQPEAFPPLFVATVRASERTGDLATAMRRYIDYENRMNLVRDKLVGASIYPVLLLAAGALVTLFLLGYVVPKFSQVYADSGRALPLASQWLLQIGRTIEGHGLALLVAVLGVLAAFGILARHAAGSLHALAWRIPAIGSRLLVYQLARFYRTVGMLLAGGTPILAALDMTALLLPAGLRAQLARARARIGEGLPISTAMAGAGLATPVADRMLRVGERTGDMAGMMERIAGFCDDELARWVDRFVRLFEPLLMCAIGLVIGVIVVLMYLPIFELAGSIQ